jgi:diguanylate cyclase (GGDEF)-like protein
MLFLDLDGFKIVNDTLGHASGDELLVEVARRLRATVRPQDVPARLGGDEFAVLLDDTQAPRAEAVAARIAAALEVPFRIGKRLTTVHASIGIALADAEMRSPDELFAQADLAMYSAKSERSRRYATYEPELHEEMRERHALAFDLEEALKRREIVVYFQPAVAISTGRIHAFEALARWQHPSRGLVLPDAFLPTAAESGIMEELGRFVIDEACKQASRWQEVTAEHGGTGLWLNLSPSELQRDTLVEELSLALTRTHLDARLVTLEVTEASVVQDETRVARLMSDLRELGFTISIDDFGTGYSSLSRLRDFPIDMLKIPKPFVDRLARDGVDASLVDAILRLARSLGLAPVAEGIETIEQADRLRSLGCDLAQGFFFGHPVRGDDALYSLRRNQLRPVAAVARAS